MSTVTVFTEVTVVVAAMLLVATVVIVGPRRVWHTAPEIPTRLRTAAPSVAVLGAVLLVNSLVRNAGVDLSWVVGINITGEIYALEGALVADIQSFTTPLATLFFGAIYVYGYSFLLVFPLLVGLLLPETRHLRQTVVAYTVNYGVGLLCYLAFVAYGPRNYMPDLVQPLLYDAIPRFQLVTSEVNANTNVFPSLHTSLSVTVALLARRVRDAYPLWFPLAAFLAMNVALATVVLGIHWATDVAAGALLGILSVWVATHERFDKA